MIKRVWLSVLATLFLVSNTFAWQGGFQGGYKGGFAKSADHYKAQMDAGYGHLPQGLTFYKDFTRIPPGTYSQSGLLDADYSIGSPVATFTSTNGLFTITAKGYNATTANDEVLKYLTAGNRTAAQETIIIKFSTSSVASDGNHYLISTDDGFGGRRIFRANANTISSGANRQESNNCSITDIATNLMSINTLYVVGVSIQHTSPYMAGYFRGLPSGTNETVDDFINNSWISNFFIGCANSSDLQFDGVISKIIIFCRALSANEISMVSNLL